MAEPSQETKEKERGDASQSNEEDCHAKEPGGTPSTELGPSSGLLGVGGRGAGTRLLEPSRVAAGGTGGAWRGAPKKAAGTGVIAARETERIASGSRFI